MTPSEQGNETAGTTDALRAALSGRYVVERELGRGGMATVYLARDVRHTARWPSRFCFVLFRLGGF